MLVACFMGILKTVHHYLGYLCSFYRNSCYCYLLYSRCCLQLCCGTFVACVIGIYSVIVCRIILCFSLLMRFVVHFVIFIILVADTVKIIIFGFLDEYMHYIVMQSSRKNRFYRMFSLFKDSNVKMFIFTLIIATI